MFVCLLLFSHFFIWDVWISSLVVRKSLHCFISICMYKWITSFQGQKITFYISVPSERILLVNVINAGFIPPYFTLPSSRNDSTDIHSREVWGCLAPRRDWDISPKVHSLPNYLLIQFTATFPWHLILTVSWRKLTRLTNNPPAHGQVILTSWLSWIIVLTWLFIYTPESYNEAFQEKR